FIGSAKVLDVRPQVLVRFAAGGAFDIHNAHHALRQNRDISVATGFAQDTKPFVQQHLSESWKLRLKQWLAARKLNQVAAEGLCAFNYVLKRHHLAAVEGVFGVAPNAAKIAAGGSDEGARQPSEGAFALNRAVDLVDSDRHAN